MNKMPGWGLAGLCLIFAAVPAVAQGQTATTFQTASVAVASTPIQIEPASFAAAPSATSGLPAVTEESLSAPNKPVLRQDRPRRVELSYTFENLHPHQTYGDWNSGSLAFYSRLSPGFTWFVQGSGYNRNEGGGFTGTAGAYVDWASFLYTYSALTAGTYSEYLPKFRIDHDFNFKVGPGKQVVLTAGATYVDYFNEHYDVIFSGGPTLYLSRFILQYRLFYNLSYPGKVDSFSHLLSAGFGEEGWQWTYLVVSFGKQAYQATFTGVAALNQLPQEINQDSITVTLRHRHWLGGPYGIFGDVSYFRLDDGYDKYGFALGAFYEF